ncbi:DNA-binding protein [Bradyrhizobium sp. 482_C4_N1_1]|uniref:DNA-binding protein n=1 Tax=unclassified Bradyrhizobium TaxID=2631580 RepID=UPI003F8BEC7F
MMRGEGEIADDLLEGAEAIARYMFGTGTATKRRRVYHLAATSDLPLFRLGEIICGRRSTLLAWIAEREQAAAALAKAKQRPIAAAAEE